MKVGIIGDGQLSMMLCEAAKKLNIFTKVFSSQKESPASYFASEVQVGNIRSDEDLKKFFEGVDVVTFESDFLPFEVLSKFNDVNFKPHLKILERISDKLGQKKMCMELSIPTLPHIVLNAPFKDSIEEAQSNLGKLILKWTKGGYDGKGVHKVDNTSDAVDFCEQAHAKNVQVFAEKFIPFDRELAIVAARNSKDEFQFFPVVVTQQDKGICKAVFGPASAFGLSEKTELQIQNYIKQALTHLNYEGALAIEFFEDSSGNISLNEFAPRVHNSGHYTMTACSTTQFDAHLQGVAGASFLPLQIKTPYFYMLNLFGTKDTSSFASLASWAHPFWYKKKEARAGRKMGHINFTANSLEEFNERVEKITAWEKTKSL